MLLLLMCQTFHFIGIFVQFWASSVPTWGKHVAQHGQARCPYWAEFMPSGCPKSWCRNIHILVIRIPFVWFSVAWQFLSRIQTIQTICWQLPGSQLSVYQNITTKNQMVWQFFWKFVILLKISVIEFFYLYWEFWHALHLFQNIEFGIMSLSKSGWGKCLSTSL